MSGFIKIGDIVTLRNIKVKNYLCAEGILSDDIVVGKMDSFEDNWFQICLPRQYSAAQELEEFIAVNEVDVKVPGRIDKSTQRHLDALKTGAINEHKMNEMYMKSKHGNEVHYGDSIQLLHVKSKKYITVVGNEVAEHERENIRVRLHPDGSPDSWLIIQPRFKINQAGDAVLSNSEIKLNIAERNNEYLHCTDKGFSNDHREVNASLDPTSWYLSIFQSATDTEDPNVILYSELVSLFDPETQSTLSIFQPPAIIKALDDSSDISDDDSLNDLSEDGEVVMELIDRTVPSNGLWMIESRSGTSGGPIQWKTDQVRLRHVNTGVYMCMHRGENALDNEYTLSVSRAPSDRGTLLNVTELHSANTFLQNKKAVQINHRHGYLDKGDLREIAMITNYKCAATSNKSNAVYLFISRYENSEDDDLAQPLDIFVGSSVRNFVKMCLNSMENFLEYNPADCIDRLWPGLDVAHDKRFFTVMERCIHYLKGHPISELPPADPDAEDDDAVNEFGEIIRNDNVIGRRQRMFREQGTVDTLLQLLNGILPVFKAGPSGDCDEDEVLSIERQKTAQLNQWASKLENEVDGKRKQLVKMGSKVSKVLLRALLQAIKRNGQNQLYVANHMHVVLGWVGVQPVAADVVRELLQGNLELQTGYIGKHEIRIFTNQLTSPTARMKSMYFTMLKAFCACSGHGISRNQGLVMDAVMPLVDEVFVKIINTSTTDADTTKEYFSSSLYCPLSVEDDAEMLGALAVKEGLPYLSISWECRDDAFSPHTLFGTAVVPLSEVFKKHQTMKRTNSRIGGAVGGMVRSQSSSNIRSALSRSNSDLSKKKPSSTPGNLLNTAPARNISVERKQAVIGYFVSQLYLLAEMCLDRNISAISEIEKIVPYEYLVSILSGQTLSNSAVKSQASSDLYGATANLMTNLYVDRESETTSRIPCLSKMWTQLKDKSNEVACVERNRIHRYGLLQHIISTHIRNMPTGGGAWDTHSLFMISILKKLISLNFYGTVEKLKDVIEPVMTVLNRRNPTLDSKEFIPLIIDEDEEEEDGDPGGAKDIAKLVSKKNHTWQKKTLKFMESVAELAIVMTVVLASTAVALVQVVNGYAGVGFKAFDVIVGLFFLIEVSLRGYVHHFVRKKWSTFFSDYFVQLDIGVVLLDIVVMGSEDALGSFGSFSGILRALRMLRLMRVVRAARLLKNIPDNNDEVAKWFLPTRYRSAAAHELDTMIEMVDTLRDVQRVIDDRNLNILLRGFVVWSEDNNSHPDKDVPRAAAVLASVVDESRELTVSNEEHDDTLMDLLMYVNADLVQSVLDLLMAHHSSVSSMMANARAVQLLVSPSREKQHKMVNDLLLELDRHIETYALWANVSNEEQQGICQRSIDILTTLRDNCRVRRTVLEFDYDYEADTQMQNLFRNFGCWDVTLKLLRKLIISNVEYNVKASKAGHDILRACCSLLFWFVYGNPVNQDELFEELDFFLDMIDMNIGAHHLYSAIFAGNESLMRRVPVRHISEMTERVCKTGRFPQYLTLLSSITAVGDKNILENQYEIVKQISSPNRQKKILVFCCPISHFEYSKKVKLMAPYLNRKDCSSDDIAAELAYHVELLKVLSGCTLGWYNITTIETKVQAMFNYVDIIDAILDEKCLLYIKIRTGLFLYNAILEVEMLIPGLQYSIRIWELLQYCVEVLASGKDTLRQIERNGWDAPTSSRQNVEFTVICAMITFGFFKIYYDPIGFPREHKATYGTQASSLNMSMSDIESIVNHLFDHILGIYELDTPLLSVKHKSYFYGALEYLAKAKGIILSDFVENTHSNAALSEIAQALENMTNVNHLEEKASAKLNHFLDCMAKDETYEELCKEEFESVIRKISSLPLASDTTSTSTVRYEPFLKKLVDHIRSGTKIITHSTGREKYLSERRTKTAIWIIKLFRTMIENVWGMTIDERDDDGGEEQDIASAAITHTFNTCGATTLCLDLIASGINKELVLECIKLSVAMLFKEGGALAVQQTMYQHLSNTDSEFFFLQLRKIMAELISWHDWCGITSLEEDKEPNLPDDIIAVRFMQLMCEGHYCPNQDILREQPDKIVSVNLLDDMVAYLVCVGRIPCRTSTAAALAVGATVLEVIQGPCEGNQDHFALNTSLLETLNHQMRARMSGDCDKAEEIELKKTGIDIFQALLEGQGQKTAVYERVLSVIHLDVIQLMCIPPEQPDEGDEDAVKQETEEVDEEVEEVERLLRTESLVLLQMLCDFRPSLRDELEVLNNVDGVLGGESVACVEIMWRGELQRRFFNIPDICQDFTESAKSNFMEYVDRSSLENKHLDMYRRAKVIYTDLLHQKFLREMQLNKVFSRKNQNRATWVTFIICLVINLLMLFYYDGEECLELFRVNDDDVKVSCGIPHLPYTIREAVDILNILQIAFSSFTLVLFLIVRAPVHYLTAIKNGNGVLMAVVATALDPLTLYYFVYVMLATLSINIDHILTLLLLDIVVKNSYAMDVLIAIFTPIKQLAMAMLLCIIVMYIFSMVMFLQFNGPGALLFPDDCRTLWTCFKFNVLFGRSGDYGAMMHQRINNQWIFTFAFDIAIRFVLLNVVRGITVDTFSELRLAKLERLRDTFETCFICGIDKQVFDRDKSSKGFKVHVKKEHNMWNYLYFIIYIWEQDKDDDDGLEQYVRRSIDADDISWLPANKAMALNIVDENAAAETRDKFMKDMHTLESNFVNRLTQLHTEVTAAVIKIKKAMDKQQDIATVQTFEVYVPNQMPVSTRPQTVPNQQTQQKVYLQKSSTMSSVGAMEHSTLGTIVSIEITEIVGLTFPSRTLDSIFCNVVSANGTTAISNAHVMIQDHAPSLVLFDPRQIVITTDYKAMRDANDMIVVQIARDSTQGGRYVGKVQFSLEELTSVPHQRLEKSFLADVLGSTSRGTLVINTSARDALPFESIDYV